MLEVEDHAGHRVGGALDGHFHDIVVAVALRIGGGTVHPSSPRRSVWGAADVGSGELDSFGNNHVEETAGWQTIRIISELLMKSDRILQIALLASVLAAFVARFTTSLHETIVDAGDSAPELQITTDNGQEHHGREFRRQAAGAELLGDVVPALHRGDSVAERHGQGAAARRVWWSSG